MSATLTPLGLAINKYLEARDWSRRELGERASMSHTNVSRLMKGEIEPTYEALLKIADALEVDAIGLMEIAGLRTINPPIKRDPSVEYLAQRLDKLPDHIRAEAVDALAAQLDAIYRITEASTESVKLPITMALMQKFLETQGDNEATEAELRELKSIAPETYYRFLEDQLGSHWREIVKGVAEIEALLDTMDEKDQVPVNQRKAVR